LLREVDCINMRQRARTVDLAFGLVGAGSTVAVLGTAFKADSDDVRDSPALDVAATLHARGLRVRVYDPAAMGNARREHPELEYCDDAVTACRTADAVLVLTEWAEFAALDPFALADVVAHRRVVDGRLVLDPDKWRAADWEFHALGRRAS
jgi:UDPglucose 6-dehydrogenase